MGTNRGGARGTVDTGGDDAGDDGVDGAVDALEALGDRSRRAIVECLRERPHGVAELASRLPVSRPAVSQHLRVLKDAGLVTDRAEGTRRIYALDPAGLAMLRSYLDVVWRDGLAAFAAHLDDREGDPT